MNKLSIGDRVRFLNSVGGGIVKGFQSKQIAIIEDEYGFDVPVLISELVVVQPAGSGNQPTVSEKEKLSFGTETATSKTGVSFGKGDGKKSGDTWKDTSDNHWKDASGETREDTSADVPTLEETPEETPEGEQITACLAWLPMDIKNLSSTNYECYFVNDSNYYLFFNYMTPDGDSYKIRYSGLVEPNTKIFLEELEKSDLNEIEKVTVQFIAFKRHKPFSLKEPCSVNLRIDTVKFYKLHSFHENDYFEEDAITSFIMRNDTPEDKLYVSASELEQAMKEKKRLDNRPQRERTTKARKETVTEVDLHINELLETTAGMSNADILEYQLNKFNEVMKEHLHRKNHKIVFIHGKGDGVLRNAIIKELKNNYPKSFYQDASFREYGYGATMVTVK